MSSVLDLMRKTDQHPERFNERPETAPPQPPQRGGVWKNYGALLLLAGATVGAGWYWVNRTPVRTDHIEHVAEPSTPWVSESVEAQHEDFVVAQQDYAPPAPPQESRKVAAVATLVPPVPKNRVGIDMQQPLPDDWLGVAQVSSSRAAQSGAAVSLRQQVPEAVFDPPPRQVEASRASRPQRTQEDKVDIEDLVAELLVRALQDKAHQPQPIAVAQPQHNNRSYDDTPIELYSSSVVPSPTPAITGLVELTEQIGLQGTMSSGDELLAILVSGRLVSVGDEVNGYQITEIGNGWIRCEGIGQKIGMSRTSSQQNQSSEGIQ